MSELKPDIDLETLARPATEIKQPRRFKVIYLVPLTILVIFLLVLSGSIRELLLEKTEVTVVRPSVVTGVVAPAGTVVLQAAGWVEPEPFPVSVTSLNVPSPLLNRTRSCSPGNSRGGHERGRPSSLQTRLNTSSPVRKFAS